MGNYSEKYNLIKYAGRKQWYESQQNGRKIKVPLFPQESIFDIEMIDKKIVRMLDNKARKTIIKPHETSKGSGLYAMRIAIYKKAMDKLCRELGVGSGF